MGLFLFCTFLFIALAIFACSACHSSGTLFFHFDTHTQVDCNMCRFIKFSSLSAPTKIEELTAGSDEKTQRSPAGNRTQGLANSGRTRRPWVRFPAGLRCVFSSDPAVSSFIFVGAEREENLIRNDPDKSEFTMCRFS